MHTLHYTTRYILHTAQYSKQYTNQCTVYSVQCTVYSVQCRVYSVQCAVCSVHCRLHYSPQCSLPCQSLPSVVWILCCCPQFLCLKVRTYLVNRLSQTLKNSKLYIELIILKILFTLIWKSRVTKILKLIFLSNFQDFCQIIRKTLPFVKNLCLSTFSSKKF